MHMVSEGFIKFVWRQDFGFYQRNHFFLKLFMIPFVFKVVVYVLL